MTGIDKKAEISGCGLYRYSLSRRWDVGSHSLPIIMLNPSVADADIDDPTINRCMTFARRDGFGGITVMNLFAYRATKPEAMLAASEPVGPENDWHIEAILDKASNLGLPVLTAWGTHGNHRGRSAEIVKKALSIGASLTCLGTTKGGHPRHPLYVAGTQPFIPFD